MSADRPSYRPSGRVNLPVFLPLAGLALGVAVGMGFALAKAFHNGLFFVVMTPLVLGLPVAGAVWAAVTGGGCRNRVVGGLLGLAAGLVYFLSHYQFDLAHQLGNRWLTRVDILPAYIELRVKTDVSRKVGAKDDAGGQPRAGDTADLVFRWLKFGLEGLAAVLPALAAGFGPAGKPFSERHRRWLIAHPVKLPADAAEPITAAVRDGDPADLNAAFDPAAAPDPRRHTLLTVEYVPGEPDSPVYLTVAAVTGADNPKKTKVRRVLRQSLLTPDEAAVLGARLALPRAGFPAQAGPAAGAAVPTPAAISARVDTLPEAGGALSGGAKAWATVAGFAPLILGLGTAAGLAYAGFEWRDEAGDAGLAVGCVLGAVTAVATLVYMAGYADYLPSRVYYARSRAAVAARPDAIVDPDDPDAAYVQMIPRANWGKVMLENAAEVGFLKVDHGRRVILYEGDRERWVIPAESILSLAVEEYRVPANGEEAATYAAAVVTADVGGRVWEAPLSYRHIWFGKRGVRERRQLAAALRDVLAEILPEPAGD